MTRVKVGDGVITWTGLDPVTSYAFIKEVLMCVKKYRST